MAKRDLDQIVADFEAEDAVGEPLPPDYNVAPTDPVPCVLTRHRSGDAGGPVVRQVRRARWGLVPSWSPDTRRAARMINARAETITELPAFRSAMQRRRCLVPADGWYEWTPGEGGGKQPTYLTRPGGLAFAGLYEIWGPDKLLTVSIVTTAATGELTRVHERMPLVLPRARWAPWLDPERADATALLEPDLAAIADIELRPVGTAVGDVRNDGPRLIEPVPAAQALF